MSDVPPPPGTTPPPPGQPPYGQQPYGQPAGQPAYGQPAYGAHQPAYGAASPKTNVMAILSLVLSLVLCGVGGLVSIPLGIVGLGQIKRSQGRETGRGLAIAGIAIGAITLLIGIGAFVSLAIFADEVDDTFDDICRDIDSDGDGVADGDDCGDLQFTTTTSDFP